LGTPHVDILPEQRLEEQRHVRERRGFRRPKLMNQRPSSVRTSWLNRTTLGIGLTSLFSDWSHEIATSILPAFLASLGAGPAWLGVIEGTADGLSSFSKLAAGHYTDRLKHRKPLVEVGYVVTALATGALALATSAWHVLIARTSGWLGRGVRTPGRKALLAAGVSPDAYGRAFGFERMMDTLGAITGLLRGLWCPAFWRR
jgi:MFS family permease